jgi:riboflavin synthase
MKDARGLIKRAPYPPAKVAAMLAAFDEAWGLILLGQDVAQEHDDAARKRLATIIVDQAAVHASNLHSLAARPSRLSTSGDAGGG